MAITVLQDHTDFMDRMIQSAYDHTLGIPLSIPLLDMIRVKTMVATYRGKLMTLADLRDLAEGVDPAEQRRISKLMANAVEAPIEAWYCIAHDEGAQWLQDNHAGPVLAWNGALWWGKLKGLDLTEEIHFHECFKKRSNRHRPDPGEGKTAGEDYRRRDVPGGRIFRPNVGEIE